MPPLRVGGLKLALVPFFEMTFHIDVSVLSKVLERSIVSTVSGIHTKRLVTFAFDTYWSLLALDRLQSLSCQPSVILLHLHRECGLPQLLNGKYDYSIERKGSSDRQSARIIQE